MGTRNYTFSIPLPIDDTFRLLLLAGERLPTSSELAGAHFGRWENSLAEQEAGLLEWQMYDHKTSIAKIKAKLDNDGPDQTQSKFQVTLLGQLIDLTGAYKGTLRLLLDPFMELVKQEISPQNDKATN
jgi:hypothetical protein